MSMVLFVKFYSVIITGPWTSKNVYKQDVNEILKLKWVQFLFVYIV